MKTIDNNFLKGWNSVRWNVFAKNSTIILCTWKASNYDHWQKTLWNRPMIIRLSNKKGEKSVKEITNYYRRQFIEEKLVCIGNRGRGSVSWLVRSSVFRAEFTAHRGLRTLDAVVSDENFAVPWLCTDTSIHQHYVVFLVGVLDRIPILTVIFIAIDIFLSSCLIEGI